MPITTWLPAAAAIGLLLAGCTSTVVNGRPHTVPQSRSTGSSAAPTHLVPATSSSARLDDPVAVRRIEADTRADLAATNTYSYRTLAADLSAGLAHTTGTFQAQYRRAFTSLVEPTARRVGAGQSLQVNVVGIRSRPGPTQADLLVELQTRVTRRSAAPRLNPETVAATVDEVHGRWLLSGVRTGGGGGPLGSVGTAGLSAAGRAVDTGVVAISTFRRAHFAADYAHALSLTTGNLHRDLVSARATTLATLARMHLDVSGVVTGVAAVTAQGNNASFLVTSLGYRSTSPSAPTDQDLEITAQLVGTRWLLSDVSSLGLR